MTDRAAFEPETATPDDVERLIDLRVARLDEEIAKQLAVVEELRAERKRWVGVTGGRSRVPAPDGDGSPTPE